MNTDHEQETPEYAPRYAIIEEGDGFRVEGRERCPVSVHLAPSKTFFLIGESADQVKSWNEDDLMRSYRYDKCGLYDYYWLLELIAEKVMQRWQRPPNPPNYWSGIRAWALGRTKRALHYRGVYQQWQRLLALVPQIQRQVAKAVFAATFGSKQLGCETWLEVYQHSYLINDILRYRAAASAVHYAERLASIVGCVMSEHYEVASSPCCPEPLRERFLTFSQQVDMDEDPFTIHDYERLERNLAPRERRQDIIHFLTHDWKALYSGSGKAGKSLRRTLMNLPGGISGNLLCELPKLDCFLRRPVTDRVELTLLLIWARYLTRHQYRSVEPEMWEGNIYMKARREEILSALHLLSAHRQRALPGEPRLTPWKRGLELFVGYLDDYCDACRQDGTPAHQGNVVGLTEKALRWHREVQERREQLYQNIREGTALTQLPPVPLPDDPSMTFLRTAKDILSEGALMHHCIASYTFRAVHGECYLFHVDYQGTEASVQVDRAGRVVQAYGPYNSINMASEYGKRLLTQWGKNFPPHKELQTSGVPEMLADEA